MVDEEVDFATVGHVEAARESGLVEPGAPAEREQLTETPQRDDPINPRRAIATAGNDCADERQPLDP